MCLDKNLSMEFFIGKKFFLVIDCLMDSCNKNNEYMKTHHMINCTMINSGRSCEETFAFGRFSTIAYHP